MRRLSRDLTQSGASDLFDGLARREGYDLTDPASRDHFLATVAATLDQQQRSPIRRHGRRVETMFAYVAAALGRCAAVKQEDAGDVYVPSPGVSVPDYRLVLEEGDEWLVEVKNCHQRDPTAPLRIKAEYLDSLRRYASLFRRPLWFAIYWSAWRLWTLVPADGISRRGPRYAVTLLDALRANEMSRLGDCKLGTRPELRLRVLADHLAPRRVDPTGQFDLTAAAVEVYCGAARVTDRAETALALTLMRFGSWSVTGPSLLGPIDYPEGIEFVAAPEEYEAAQGFAVVGDASSIVSRQFDSVTVRDGEIMRVSPARDPWSVRTLLSAPTQSDTLPLWRLYVQPAASTTGGGAV